MRLLLDQGLPRSSVLYLQNYGIEAVHVGDRGLATATDSKILDFGHQEGMVVVTLDADFHTLLALSGLTEPSVVRIRIESLRGEALAKLRSACCKFVATTCRKVRWSHDAAPSQSSTAVLNQLLPVETTPRPAA
jgi:predicted nuclease of predicted toxin-antitoxin system